MDTVRFVMISAILEPGTPITYDGETIGKVIQNIGGESRCVIYSEEAYRKIHRKIHTGKKIASIELREK